MDEKPKYILPERNPKTHTAHKREVWWQITLPLVFGCLLLAVVIGGLVRVATDSTTEIGRWADISQMWVMLPAFGAALLLLVLLIGVTYLVTKLIGVLPGYARLAQDTITVAMLKVMGVSNILVKPVLKLKGWLAAVQRARQVVLKPFTSRQDDEY